MLYDYILVLHVELGDNLIEFNPKKTILWYTYVVTYDMSVEIFPTGCADVATYVTQEWVSR